jgi:hypothetical protein
MPYQFCFLVAYFLVIYLGLRVRVLPMRPTQRELASKSAENHAA